MKRKADELDNFEKMVAQFSEVKGIHARINAILNNARSWSRSRSEFAMKQAKEYASFAYTLANYAGEDELANKAYRVLNHLWHMECMRRFDRSE